MTTATTAQPLGTRSVHLADLRRSDVAWTAQVTKGGPLWIGPRTVARVDEFTDSWVITWRGHIGEKPRSTVIAGLARYYGALVGTVPGGGAA